MDRQTAEAIALQGLAFLAEDLKRLQRFLKLTGLDVAQIRAGAATPDLLCAVLEHLSADESLLLVFTASCGIGPESVAPAISLLRLPHA